MVAAAEKHREWAAVLNTFLSFFTGEDACHEQLIRADDQRVSVHLVALV